MLTGGELPALCILDSTIRYIDGILGKIESADYDSFEDGLLEYPQYTKPREYRGLNVPEVLLNGNHAEIAKWRKEQQKIKTQKVRPDLWEKYIQKNTNLWYYRYMEFDDFSIGIDIEDISRFENKDDSFVNRIFSKEEINYCKSKLKSAQHYAVRYCAKEAVIKALSAFNENGIELNKIEIYHNENKVPQVRFLNNLENKYRAKITLSHEQTKAIAYVVLQKRNGE